MGDLQLPSRSNRQRTYLKLEQHSQYASYLRKQSLSIDERETDLRHQATLFSAVLTAFVIESMKIIQEDPSSRIYDVLLVVTQQLANQSTPAYKPTAFVAPSYGVRVNVWFFISLSVSLITALVSVIALQWVGNYDRGLNTSSPEYRALQRHHRRVGSEKWGMDQIIMILPQALFLSFLTFLCGLADWLWNIHHGVAVMIHLCSDL